MFGEVCCIPFIAPAYMAMTFGALIISHLYLYSYDRVARRAGGGVGAVGGGGLGR